MDQMLLCVTFAFSAPLRFIWSPFSFTAETPRTQRLRRADSRTSGVRHSRSLCPPAAAEPAHSRKSLETSRPVNSPEW